MQQQSTGHPSHNYSAFHSTPEKLEEILQGVSIWTSMKRTRDSEMLLKDFARDTQTLNLRITPVAETEFL